MEEDKKRKNKSVILLLVLGALVGCFILLLVLVIKMPSEATSCMGDPIGYFQDHSNMMCTCNVDYLEAYRN